MKDAQTIYEPPPMSDEDSAARERLRHWALANGLGRDQVAYRPALKTWIIGLSHGSFSVTIEHASLSTAVDRVIVAMSLLRWGPQ